MASVNVLHHGRCFDGAASAALFAEFYSAHVDTSATYSWIPKIHRKGDPYDEADYAAEVNASVDFRYSQDPRLHWYFDHHKSAFQLDGDRAHFDADASGQKFHDELAPSCASYMAKICAKQWGYDADRHAELIRWTEIIDQAQFPNPAVPVLFEEPAMKVAGFIQVVSDPETIGLLVHDLTRTSLAEVAKTGYVEAIMGPRLAQHREDMSLIEEASSVDAGILAYDLLEEGPRVFSHFIPYYHHPKVRYVVGVYGHTDGDLRITVGHNPWLPSTDRDHDIAALCERFGGGGHAHVGGISFPLDERDRCADAYRQILALLRAAK